MYSYAGDGGDGKSCEGERVGTVSVSPCGVCGYGINEPVR